MSSTRSTGEHPRNLSTRDFIDALIAEVRDGQCFVPFLGSGISSASGIIMGMEFTNYLAYVTHRVIETTTPATASGQKVHHDLLNHGWPPLPTQEEINKAITWIRMSFSAICARNGWDINKAEHDENIRSLTSNAANPEKAFAATLGQPPIPQVIRSWNGPPKNETNERLRRMLERQQSALDPNHTTDLEDYFLDPALTQEERIKEKAIRALADWKTTLAFLSRIRIDEKQRLILGDEQSAIIDAFNHFITRGRHPNLCHQMIAHLSTPMRFHTVLSTNFDDLIETAFKDQGIPLAAMAVTTTGGLPSHHAVAAQGTLVKLHGQFHETRADKTLDDEPTPSDKETFTAYMHRGKGHPNRPTGTLSGEWPTDRLLVIGYSGSDHRCVQMIKHWLESSIRQNSNDTLIYWICHNDADVAKVNRLFRSESLARHINITECTRPDYLLFEVYQRLCYALPPGNNSYEFPHAIPPYRASREQRTTSQSGKAKESRVRQREQTEDAITTSILSCVSGLNGPEKTPVVRRVPWTPKYRTQNETTITTAWLIDAPTMVASAAALAYDEITRSPSKKVIWLELNDAYDGEAVLRDFIRTLSVRCGRFSTQHVALHPKSIGPLHGTDTPQVHTRITRYVNDLLTEYRVSAQSIVLMLYGRDGYGQHAPFLPVKWSDDVFKQLHAVIEGIAGAGVSTIYFPLTVGRAETRTSYVTDSTNKYIAASTDGGSAGGQRLSVNWTHDSIAEQILNPEANNGNETIQRRAARLSQVAEVADNLLRKYMQYDEVEEQHRWKPVNFDKQEFEQIQWLYGMTLIRHSRHPSVLFSGAIYPSPHEHNTQGIDNDFYRSHKVKQWLNQLEWEDVLFVKPGGAIWAHRDLTSILNGVTSHFTHPNARHVSLFNRRSKIHYGIGEWYQKAFFSSGHIIPLVEAVHHFVQSALAAHDFAIKSSHDDSISKQVRRRLFIIGFNQAHKTLLIGWDVMKYWLASGHQISWLAEARDQIKKEKNHCLETLKLEEPERKACETAYKDFLSIVDTASSTVHSVGSGWVAEAGIAIHPAGVAGGPVEGTVDGSDPFKKVLSDFRSRHKWITLGLTDQNFNEALGKLYSTLPPCIDLHNTIVKREADNSEALESWGAVVEETSKKGKWLPLLHMLAESAFLLLRRAKIKWHAEESPPFQDWVTVSRYCELGLDGCKYLPPGLFRDELQFKAMFHQICSVALANLGRFHEARRHLTDSQSSLARSSLKTRTDQAIASIRHAEVAVTEAFWIKGSLKQNADQWQECFETCGAVVALGNQRAKLLSKKQWNDPPGKKDVFYAPPFFSDRIHEAHTDNRFEDAVAFTKRHYAVLLDEAVLQLTRAEHLLQGASQSSHWWFQLHLLHLRIYGLLKPLGADASRCLIYRHHTLEEGIRRHFLAAVRIADGEPFRLLRCVKYYRKAVKAYQTIWAGQGGSFRLLFESIAGNDSEGQPAARKAVFLGARNAADEVNETASQGYDYKPSTWPELLHCDNFLAQAYNGEIRDLTKDSLNADAPSTAS